MTASRILAAAAAACLFVAAPAWAGPSPLAPYDGSNPFDCELQQVGTGTDFPDPDADPFCVEYDKTHQNLTEGGVLDFMAQEPARFAAAGDKCFYFQHDHWRGSVDQNVEQSETYNWDGSYFFDKARGVAGAYVENFSFNNRSFDPTAFPWGPDEWKSYFGYGSGGAQITESIPVDPACVENAENDDPYRDPEEEPAQG